MNFRQKHKENKQRNLVKYYQVFFEKKGCEVTWKILL